MYIPLLNYSNFNCVGAKKKQHKWSNLGLLIDCLLAQIIGYDFCIFS
ncbi:hypothetical protein C427_1194 [Paraglaciecola psychrophila 170]|uniref:Uncharacterized protein n=1 Tax=Paraglaciecola psychrophila 170 TaxID=1129794 RepID=K7ANX5_9ALTE|nr:hypothetical protein C427_1194 [Paraglaciecola psychrophila 170]GAC37030.1 hypothetical protein GPSY_1395 [Paraglaciecola psychrophila 170]